MAHRSCGPTTGKAITLRSGRRGEIVSDLSYARGPDTAGLMQLEFHELDRGHRRL